MSLSKLSQKIVNKICIKTYAIWEIFGLHIVPNNFYWPIPDSNSIRQHDFNEPLSIEGLRLNEKNATELLASVSQFRNEYQKIYSENGFEGSGDGATYYGMIRYKKPKHIVEVGAGHSTRVAISALEQNFSENGEPYRLTVIEPYPRPVLTEVIDSNPNIDLIISKVEETPLDIFRDLSEGDFLFIDTSHNIATGNDVYHLYLKILPFLNIGVVVHVHDIFIPYDYPRQWVEVERKIWSEQYLLHAFMLYNNAFEVILPLHKLFQNDKALTSRSLIGLDENDPIGPSSFWISRWQ